MKLKLLLFHFVIPAVIMGCANAGKMERVLKTAHFAIFYTQLDDKNIGEIADSLELSYPRITSQLQSGDLPVVNVHFYEDAAALTKVFPDFPVWAVGQATSVSEIHILSPNNPKQDYQTMIRNIKHEFAHCVSLKINPAIANNPRWLWETVALYQANLPWDPRMLSYLVDQKPPSISALNEFSSPVIYEVGHFIGQYIVETHGRAALKTLIQNNGNVQAAFSMTEEEFTNQWFEFVKRKYSM